MCVSTHARSEYVCKKQLFGNDKGRNGLTYW